MVEFKVNQSPVLHLTLKIVFIDLLGSKIPRFIYWSFITLVYLQFYFIDSGSHQSKLNLAITEKANWTSSASIPTYLDFLDFKVGPIVS